MITEAVSGRAVDTEATVQALNEALARQQEGTVRADAVITEQEPEITSEELASIQDVLGTCTTDFSSSGQPVPPIFPWGGQDQRQGNDARRSAFWL